MFGADPFSSDYKPEIPDPTVITADQLIYQLRKNGIDVVYEKLGYEMPMATGLSSLPQSSEELLTAIIALDEISVVGSLRDGVFVRNRSSNLDLRQNVVSFESNESMGLQEVFDTLSESTGNRFAVVSTTVNPEEILVPPLNISNLRMQDAISLIFEKSSQIKSWSAIKTYKGDPVSGDNLVLIQIERY